MGETQHYDFIIVGAGSAGSVLANRLSADSSHRVLLLEAGPERHWMSPIPISFGRLIDDPVVNWCYFSQPEPGTKERKIPVPRGRVLGGSSAINGLVYVRGQPLDYNTWAQLGNRGWSFDDVLPLFQRIERYESPGNESRGRGGPLGISEAVDQSPLYDALFAAGEQVGLPRNPDYNGTEQEGFCKTQTTISAGRRMSTALCYLKPARRRSNLTVMTNALTEQLLLEGKRCVGVRFSQAGKQRSAKAEREVVVCAGAINSPQLLELSGIGQPDLLREHGVAVQHELLGVGENLRDHITPRLMWKIKKPGITYNDRARGAGLVWQVLRYATTRRGFLCLPSGPVLAFLRTRAGLQSPDVQLHFVPFMIDFSSGKRGLAKDSGITIACYQLRPESTGSLHIRSADPKAHPAIRFNFLADEIDRQAVVGGVRYAQRIIEAPAMDDFRGEQLQPGAALKTDDEILDWIRGRADTAYHPVGTCKMGNDPRAVVDDQLRVHGLSGLRIADGSIMPTLVSGNTNAACIMIGEKASDLILGAGATA